VITGASITPVRVEDRHCFEMVSGANSSKKASKKYVFAAKTEHERDRWVQALRQMSGEAPAAPLAGAQLSTAPASGAGMNPLAPAHSSSSSSLRSSDEAEVGVEMSSPPRQSSGRLSSATAREMSGYLQKKSPSVLKGWQKRFFLTLSNGDVQYFKSHEDSREGKSRGIIRIADLRPDDAVELDEKTLEVVLHTVTKDICLKAASLNDATEWAQNLLAWQQQRLSSV
jgi:hypothetical protein